MEIVQLINLLVPLIALYVAYLHKELITLKIKVALHENSYKKIDDIYTIVTALKIELVEHKARGKKTKK